MSFTKALETFGKVVATVVTAEKLGGLVSDGSTRVARWYRGEKLAVLGPAGVGKDSLFRRLRRSAIPEEHTPTPEVSRVGRFELRWALPRGDELRLTAARSRNVGGEVADRDRHWTAAVEGATLVFYLLDLDALEGAQHQPGGRVHEDLRWLAAHLGQTAARSRIHLLVNKVDRRFGQDMAHDAITTELRPRLDELSDVAARILSAYRHRLTGITPTSLRDDYLFGVSFGAALQAVADGGPFGPR